MFGFRILVDSDSFLFVLSFHFVSAFLCCSNHFSLMYLKIVFERITRIRKPINTVQFAAQISLPKNFYRHCNHSASQNISTRWEQNSTHFKSEQTNFKKKRQPTHTHTHKWKKLTKITTSKRKITVPVMSHYQPEKLVWSLPTIMFTKRNFFVLGPLSLVDRHTWILFWKNGICDLNKRNELFSLSKSNGWMEIGRGGEEALPRIIWCRL